MNETVCKDRGFNIIIGKNNKRASGRLVTLICEYGKKMQATKKTSKSDDKVITSKRPKNDDDKCPAFFSAFELPNGRLLVRKNGGCCWGHTGHVCVKKKYMKEGKKALPKQTLETAQDLLQSYLPTAFVKEWIAITSGVHLSNDSIQALRKSVMTTEFSVEGKESSECKFIFCAHERLCA